MRRDRVGTVKRERIISVSVTVEEADKFKAICAANGTNQSAMTRGMIRECLKRNGLLARNEEMIR